jgi:hypothetical protein
VASGVGSGRTDNDSDNSRPLRPDACNA